MKSPTHVLIAHIQELVKLNSAVREGTEDTLLLHLGSELGVGNFSLQGLKISTDIAWDGVETRTMVVVGGGEGDSLEDVSWRSMNLGQCGNSEKRWLNAVTWYCIVPEHTKIWSLLLVRYLHPSARILRSSLAD